MTTRLKPPTEERIDALAAELVERCAAIVMAETVAAIGRSLTDLGRTLGAKDPA